MTKKKRVKAIYLVDLYCDKCGNKMKSTNISYPTYPIQHEYQCECGHKEMTTTLYPHLEYEYEEDLNDIGNTVKQ